MAKRAASSSRHSVLAILLFVSIIAFYTTFLADDSNVQAQTPTNVSAADNAKCAASWDTLRMRFYQENIKKGMDHASALADANKRADTANKAVQCGSVTTGLCNFGQTPPTPHATVCDAHAVKNQPEQMKTPEETMKDALKNMPMPMMMPPMMMPMMGGGMPPMIPMIPMMMPKMPMMPMPKMPKMPMLSDIQQKDRTCPDGSQKPIFSSCPTQETVTATRDMNGDGTIDAKDDAIATAQAREEREANAPASFAERIMNFFGLSETEKPGADVAQAGGDTHSFESQLEAIANSANPESPANMGVRAYIVAQQETGAPPLTPAQFNALRVAAEADPQGFAEQVRQKYPQVDEVNDLLPASGTFGEGLAGFDGTTPAQPTFIERIANYFEMLFGF